MKRGEDPFQSFLVLLNSVCNPNQNSGAGGLARSPNYERESRNVTLANFPDLKSYFYAIH